MSCGGVNLLEAHNALLVDYNDRTVGCAALLIVHSIGSGSLGLGMEVGEHRVRYVAQ